MAGQPSFPQDFMYRLERVEAELRELHRKRPRRPPNLRDLQDVNGWGAANGHALIYDQALGRYRPALLPPFLRFNLTGPISVSSSDHDPVGGPGRLIQVRARLTTTGSSTTTALLKHLTTTVATFTFTSGQAVPSSWPTVSYSFDDPDYWWLDVTAAGTGAEGLVVNGWGTAA